MNTPSALFVDLYELTMAQVYLERGMTQTAVFELTVRGLPEGWDFFIAVGLERALAVLESFRFSEDELTWLADQPQLQPSYIEQLGEIRFSGEVWAPLEGTVVYPHEPLIQVIAPLPEAQIVETAMINLIAYPTLVASKAARAVDNAAGRSLIEFGGRRAHGTDAALDAARAAYIAGFDATSSVEAGRRFGIPTVGTMAHSFVLAVGDENTAFDTFVSTYPDTTLLVDTYDTQVGVQRAIDCARRAGAGSVGAIRIDSGELLSEAHAARAALDAAGLHDVNIIVSGGLDEFEIAELVAANAPIDTFACGTNIVAPPDAATLDAAYKLVEYDGRPVAKRSHGKPSLPGRKQVWRTPHTDYLRPAHDPPLEGATPVLEPVMLHGERVGTAPSLSEIRQRAARERGRRRLEIDPQLQSLVGSA